MLTDAVDVFCPNAGDSIFHVTDSALGSLARFQCGKMRS